MVGVRRYTKQPRPSLGRQRDKTVRENSTGIDFLPFWILLTNYDKVFRVKIAIRRASPTGGAFIIGHRPTPCNT